MERTEWRYALVPLPVDPDAKVAAGSARPPRGVSKGLQGETPRHADEGRLPAAEASRRAERAPRDQRQDRPGDEDDDPPPLRPGWWRFRR